MHAETGFVEIRGGDPIKNNKQIDNKEKQFITNFEPKNLRWKIHILPTSI